MNFGKIAISTFLVFSFQVANSSGFYTDLSIGKSKYPTPYGRGPDVTMEVDRDSVSYSLAGGYSFNNNIAVELAYNDLGGFKQDVWANFPPYYGDQSSSSKYDYTSVGLYIVPSYPISEVWSIYAKIGRHSVDAEGIARLVTYADGRPSGYSSTSISGSDDDSVIGLGVGYSMTETWSVKVAYMEYGLGPEELKDISVAISYKY